MNNKCRTKGCRKKPAKYRKICYACRRRNYKKNHPIEYAYHNLKQNAKRRKKIFTLTIEQFRQFCIKYDYIAKKGITGESYGIDCVINELGYTADNISILKNVDNANKGTKILSYDYLSNTATVYKLTAEEANADLPF